MIRQWWQFALSSRITEGKLKSQNETLEPTCAQIFLAQKPCSKDFLFFLLPFRFFITLLTLNFFPILDILALTKHRAVIVNQSVHALPKLFPSHIIILSYIVIPMPCSSQSSTSSVGFGLDNSITAPTAPPTRAPATVPAFLASRSRFSSSDSSPSSNSPSVTFAIPRIPIRAVSILEE